MSSTMHGMDAEKVTAFAGSLDTSADKLEDIVNRLEASLDNLEFRGPDMDAFHAKCQSENFPTLRKTATVLREAAKTAISNAEAQQTASASDGSGATKVSSRPASAGPASAGPASAPQGPTQRSALAPASHKPQEDPNIPNPDGKGLDIYGTEGPQPYDGGLGEARPEGQTEFPEAPYWEPKDPGSDRPETGEFSGKSRWGESSPRPEPVKIFPWWTLPDPLETRHGLVTAGAVAKSQDWPHGAGHLLHFLGNSGETVNVDVDTVLSDCPEFLKIVRGQHAELAEAAVAQAQAMGATNPVSFPINTPYDSHNVTWEESEDWHTALGSFNHNISGNITVYPPETPWDRWTYSINSQVNIRDRFNIDGNVDGDAGGGKIAGVNFTDEQLQELHWAGLAQEFNVTGESSHFIKKGSVGLPEKRSLSDLLMGQD